MNNRVEEAGYYYPLFKFLNEQHNLVLLDSEIQEIIHEVNKFQGAASLPTNSMRKLIDFIDKNYDWFIAHSPKYGVVPKIRAKAVELMESVPTTNSMQWVRASERLPDNWEWPVQEEIFFKVDGRRADGYLLEIEGEVQFEYITAEGTIRVDNIARVEWLDESAPQTVTTPDNKNLCSCGVPYYLHATSCGWANSNTILYPKNEQEIEWQKMQLDATDSQIVINKNGTFIGINTTVAQPINTVVEKEQNMNTDQIVKLMIKSSGNNPYKGDLSKEENIIAAIQLANLCKEFADKGQSDEAMNIPSSQWAKVIIQLEQQTVNTSTV